MMDMVGSKIVNWMEDSNSKSLNAYVNRQRDVVDVIVNAFKDKEIVRMAEVFRTQCGDERLDKLKGVLKTEYGARAFSRYVIGSVVRASAQVGDDLESRLDATARAVYDMLAPLAIMKTITKTSFAYMLACDNAIKDKCECDCEIDIYG